MSNISNKMKQMRNQIINEEKHGIQPPPSKNQETCKQDDTVVKQHGESVNLECHNEQKSFAIEVEEKQIVNNKLGRADANSGR